MHIASPDGTILGIGKVGKERHEPTVPLSGRHRPDRCAYRRDRRGEHPLAAHRRSRVRPERSQERPLESGPRPRRGVGGGLFGGPESAGAGILSLLRGEPGYAQNDLRQDLWRAGHAHAGVWLVLSLVALRYVDEATLSERMRWVVRVAFPAAAVLMALGFFLSVLPEDAREPNAMIYLTYVAGVVLAVGLLTLGVGLIRGRQTPSDA